VQLIAEEGVVAIRQPDAARVLDFGPLVEVATAGRHLVDLAELHRDLERLADLRKVAVDGGVLDAERAAMGAVCAAVIDGDVSASALTKT